MGRPNPQNLKVPTPEEARRNGQKGGIASGEARKRKKTMMELFEHMLTMENEDPTLGKSLKKLGFEENENFHMAKIVTSVMRKAEDGDLKAVDLIARLVYGDSKNFNVNIEGNVDTKSSVVHIYLPERDEDPE